MPTETGSDLGTAAASGIVVLRSLITVCLALLFRVHCMEGGSVGPSALSYGRSGQVGRAVPLWQGGHQGTGSTLRGSESTGRGLGQCQQASSFCFPIPMLVKKLSPAGVAFQRAIAGCLGQGCPGWGFLSAGGPGGSGLAADLLPWALQVWHWENLTRRLPGRQSTLGRPLLGLCSLSAPGWTQHPSPAKDCGAEAMRNLGQGPPC